MTTRPLVLIAEDEAAIATLLRYNLEQAGFVVEHCADGAMALKKARDMQPDMVILDWMLPIMSGLEVCRQLRGFAETERLPIIMLTARTEETDRVRGLTLGADDYVTKPFSPAELIARIRGLLRRSGTGIPSTGLLTCGDLSIDTTRHHVQRGTRTVHLAPTEYKILIFLMQKPGKVFSRDEVLSGVWGDTIHVEERTIDVHIRRLRRALNEGGEPDLVRTVRAAGYAVTAPSLTEAD
jgi:two-component system phosphate regulon response regulator PhoB